MTCILVTGAGGLLGLNLAVEASKRYEVVGVLHERQLHSPSFETVQADLCDLEALPGLLDATAPDWVIHCAAVASLDAAERQPEFAQRLNAEVPGRLATLAAGRGLRFLQVSTDAVFDGSKGNYRETDAPNPLSVYGRTKRLAELAVKSAHPGSIIVRPVFFGWSASGKRSLAEFFYNNISAGKPVSGYTDRIFCPLLVTDLAQTILDMLDKDLNGIYHVVSADSISKYDFGVAIAEKFGLDASLIKPAGIADGNHTAERALDLTLNTGRLVKALGRRLPTVAQGIQGLFEQFGSGYRDQLLSMAAAPQEAEG